MQERYTLLRRLARGLPLFLRGFLFGLLGLISLRLFAGDHDLAGCLPVGIDHVGIGSVSHQILVNARITFFSRHVQRRVAVAAGQRRIVHARTGHINHLLGQAGVNFGAQTEEKLNHGLVLVVHGDVHGVAGGPAVG